MTGHSYSMYMGCTAGLLRLCSLSFSCCATMTEGGYWTIIVLILYLVSTVWTRLGIVIAIVAMFQPFAFKTSVIDMQK